MDDEMTFSVHKQASLHNKSSVLGALHPLPLSRLLAFASVKKNWIIFIITLTLSHIASSYICDTGIDDVIMALC